MPNDRHGRIARRARAIAQSKSGRSMLDIMLDNARYWYGQAARQFPSRGDVSAEIEAARAAALSL